MNTPLILGIETSCDETAAALVAEDMTVVSSVVSSQIDIHSRYGGVVPEIAGRAHLRDIISVVDQALLEGVTEGKDLEAIAVTKGPGLVGSLLVGISTAKSLALCWDKPVLAINHLEGHLASAMLADVPVELPTLTLLVSGGHTLLAVSDGPGRYRLLGSTRDDSVGEAYDKVARLVGLGYPGGPVLDRLASQGQDVLGFPRPMIGDGFDFSFSGLKTAVVNYVRRNPSVPIPDLAASFAAACMDVLVTKLERAFASVDVASITVVGGVAASPVLRARLQDMSKRLGVAIVVPPAGLSTDNAAMIAAAAWPQLRRNGADSLDFGAQPSLGLPA